MGFYNYLSVGLLLLLALSVIFMAIMMYLFADSFRSDEIQWMYLLLAVVGFIVVVGTRGAYAWAYIKTLPAEERFMIHAMQKI